MINFSNIKLFIFDLQQTLLDDFEAHWQAHARIVRQLKRPNIEADLKEIKRLWGMRVFDVYKKVLGDQLTDEKIRELVKKRDGYYVEIFTSSPPIVCKGAENILKYLKTNNYKVAVSSGTTKKVVEIGLNNSGLDQYVDFTVGAEDVERGKPHPTCFTIVADHYNIEPGKCIVIGDSFLDMEAAKNGDMKAIGVLTGVTDEKQLMQSGADGVYKDLAELLKTISK